jgi:alanine racemase
MSRPLVATIDLSALRHNLAVARQHAGRAKVWAVVKANAYGHGLMRAMRAFADADGLALIEIEYAVQLREAGWNKRLLLLQGFYDAADLATCIEHRIEFAVHNTAQISMIEQYVASLPHHDNPVTFDVHLKMNTGMNRLGFAPGTYQAAYHRLRAIANIGEITMMTHFANADDASNPALPFAEQVRRFESGSHGLAGDHCVANSATILEHSTFTFEAVRAGIMLYGATPGIKTAHAFGLRPTMTLSTRIIAVQEIGPGDAVGYGSRFVATQPMLIGVVACGYADGYPRHAPSGTPVIVDGIKTATVGRVSMDMLMVDLTGVKDAGVGSEVELWGEHLPIDEVAETCGTIGYELMCAVAPRVPVTEKN